MGTRQIDDSSDNDRIRAFTRALLEDLQALERMIGDGLIESGVRRIGAEQEMFLTDRAMHPAMMAHEVLERLNHPQFTTELGKFNMEVNLSPQEMHGDCLRRMELEIEGLLAQARRSARELGIRILLTGILPTVTQNDLTLDAMIPEERYSELNTTMLAHRGNVFSMAIKGLDELRISHDNVMFEACNSSFQIHFQVGAERFARLYNLAQTIAAPVLAAAVNSPVFLQHRLWSETRIALFEQAVDSRSETHLARQAKPRVIFGDRWVENSVLEIYREDVARFRVLLSTDRVESPLEALDQGRLPDLPALRLHNGTIYRWNRPCFGVSDGRAHLRIEFRALPAGPTVIDEMANAALFFGLMIALSEEHDDITKVMAFDDAKNNFMMASRYGLKARLHWLGGEMSAAHKLILNRLLPMAREGLKARSVRAADVDRYLGVIEERTKTGQTGSQWAFDSVAGMQEGSRVEERCRALTAGMYTRHLEGRPVHSWPLADLESYVDWRDSYRKVSQVMTRDLFTVGPEDLVDLAANLMDWEHIRHVPVEDNDGKLVGLISHRQLLRLVAKGGSKKPDPVAIREIMTNGPITVNPETPTLDAIDLMRKRRVSCLPVVDQDDKLVGIVTERDFINAAARLFESELREK